MGKIDEWITKIPRLKNAKVSRFSYKDAAYTNDDIEGVENYDYTRDMNVPSLNKTDTEASVLDSGARTQFSSLSKNALNHFFGRVSYNLNKVIDFLSDFLDDFRVQGIETVASSVSKTLPAYYSGKKVRLVNTNTTNAILFTFYAGQTFQGSNTVSIPAGRVIDIELLGTTWKDSLTGDLVGNASTATAPLYQWKKPDPYRYVDGEPTTYYWFKVCKITTAMTFDLELFGDNNYAYRASYRLSVARHTQSYIAYTVALLNLGQTSTEDAKLAVALDADGYLYIQTNCLWTSSLQVTLLYSRSSFSVTMDRLGYASFGSASGFTPVKIIKQTGGFRVKDGVVVEEITPIINTNIVGNVTGNLTGNADTADKWKTARNITISDADGTNTGTSVSVDGSENETLKLPATIEATLIGNADTATRTPNDYGSTLPTANSSNHGSFFYKTTGGGYLYYCAQTESSTYEWIKLY